MPTNRTKRLARRRVERGGLTPALRERLVTGHWWEFLPGAEAYPGQGPGEAELRRLWRRHREEILVEAVEPWGRRVFDLEVPPAGVDAWAGWIRSEADEHAARNGCWFDLHAAERIVFFFERFLRHSEGQWMGQPFKLMEWQARDVLMPLFGWKRPDGTRRYRRAFIEIAKKNGKSGMCSGVSLYLLAADGEASAEVYSAAADRDQATIVYKAAANMVQASETLSRRLRVVDSRKTIEYGPSLYKALSADVPTKEGLKIHGLIFDELHIQRNPKFFDTLRYGGAARRQPMQIVITTAGEDRDSICYEEYEYARKILDGTIQNDAYFAFIREADVEDPWDDPETWRKANPSLGVTIAEREMAEAVEEARRKPRLVNQFKRYRLNIWIQAEDAFLDVDQWRALDEAPGEEALRDWDAYGGLDLASTTDLAAFALVFCHPVDPVWFVKVWQWCPEENARRRQDEDGVPYLTWAREGWLELTPGNVIDYDVIRRRVIDLGEEYRVQEIAYDPWNATQLAVQLEGEGFTLVQMRQGFRSMSEPTKELERRVLSGTIQFGGNPVLAWQAGNLVVRTDPAGNIKPDKSAAAKKIDGVVAVINAISRAMVRTETTSVYAKRGVYALG